MTCVVCSHRSRVPCRSLAGHRPVTGPGLNVQIRTEQTITTNTLRRTKQNRTEQDRTRQTKQNSLTLTCIVHSYRSRVPCRSLVGHKPLTGAVGVTGTCRGEYTNVASKAPVGLTMLNAVGANRRVPTLPSGKRRGVTTSGWYRKNVGGTPHDGRVTQNTT